MRNQPGLYRLNGTQQTDALAAMMPHDASNKSITVDRIQHSYYRKNNLIITQPTRTNGVLNSPLSHWKAVLREIINKEGPHACVAMPIVGKNRDYHNGVLVCQGGEITYIEHMQSSKMAQEIKQESKKDEMNDEVRDDYNFTPHFMGLQHFGDVTTCGFRSLLVIKQILSKSDVNASEILKETSELTYSARELSGFINSSEHGLKLTFGFKARVKHAWTSTTQNFSWDTPAPTTNPVWKTVKWLWWAAVGMLPAAIKGLVRLSIQLPLNLAIQAADARVDNRILNGKRPGVAFMVKQALQGISLIPRSITEPGIIKQNLWDVTDNFSKFRRRTVRTLGIIGMVVTNLSFWGGLVLAAGAGIAAGLKLLGATIKSIPYVSSFLKTGTSVALQSAALPASAGTATVYTAAAVTAYGARQGTAAKLGGDKQATYDLHNDLGIKEVEGENGFAVLEKASNPDEAASSKHDRAASSEHDRDAVSANHLAGRDTILGIGAQQRRTKVTATATPPKQPAALSP